MSDATTSPEMEQFKEALRSFHCADKLDWDFLLSKVADGGGRERFWMAVLKEFRKAATAVSVAPPQRYSVMKALFNHSQRDAEFDQARYDRITAMGEDSPFNSMTDAVLGALAA